MSAPIGRADLLRLLRATPGEDRDALGELVGYELRVATRVADGDGSAATPRVTDPAPPGPPVAPRRRAQFWFAESFQPDDGEKDEVRPSGPGGDVIVPALTPDDFRRSDDARFPSPPPLLPWPRLHRRLRRALAMQRPGQNIDVARLVSQLGRGESTSGIPRESVTTMARRVWLLVDRHERLATFWSDQDELWLRLRRMLGAASVERRLLRDRMDVRGAAVELAVAAGDHVLVLSDLGAYADSEVAEAWASTGRVLASRGCRLAALIPCPRSRWPDRVGAIWNGQVWDRRDGSARHTRAERDVRVRRVLQLCAPLVRVERGLLRALRLIVPSGEADAGTEADAWNHPDVVRRFTTFCWLSDATAPRLRRGWAGEDDDVRRRQLEVLRVWRDDTEVPPHVKYLELAWFAALGGSRLMTDEDLDAIRQFFAGVAAMDELGAVGPWFERVKVATPESVWRDRVIGPEMRRAWLSHRGADEDSLPPGVKVSELEVEPPVTEPVTWVVAQRSEAVVMIERDSGDRVTTPGSPLLSSLTRRPHGVWASQAGRGRPVALGDDQLRTLTPTSAEIATSEGRWTLRPMTRPDWAQAIGRDRYGLWVDIAIAGVTQKLRWIPPGRFMMGSPQSEAGHRDNERPQHEVIVRSGYWLADTPVTQELWRAVMGESPSRFESDDRPVEQVNWDDAKRFLKTVAMTQPDLGLRLPREWEWEHACRAGTTTSTWVGDLEILGENNAPLLDDIAWYGGNSGVDFELDNGYDSSDWPERQHEHERAGTHPVKRKRANPHGLYDMLGNVWEWCEDWRGPYTAGTKVEPATPAGGSSRVLRGGSWRHFAWICRSAYRFGHSPSSRFDYVGFRVARGQGPAGAEPRDEVEREPGTEPRDEAEIPGSPTRRSRVGPSRRRAK